MTIDRKTVNRKQKFGQQMGIESIQVWLAQSDLSTGNSV